MGNTLGYKKTTKIMKINGETIKLKTPVQAGDILKDYPGHVLLESEMVKHFGTRAKPLDSNHELKPKRLYFLVELPKFEDERVPRRARSGIINMSAKDRLDSLMLTRRSASDLSILKPTNVRSASDLEIMKPTLSSSDGVRVKMRLRKSEVARVMMESTDEAEAAEKFIAFFKEGNSGVTIGRDDGDLSSEKQLYRKKGDRFKTREKRVGFLPFTEGEIQLAVTS